MSGRRLELRGLSIASLFNLKFGRFNREYISTERHLLSDADHPAGSGYNIRKAFLLRHIRNHRHLPMAYLGGSRKRIRYCCIFCRPSKFPSRDRVISSLTSPRKRKTRSEE